MKPLFSVDVTTDINNEVINGKEFLSRSLVTGVNNLSDPVEAVINPPKRLPLKLTVLKIACGIIGAAIAALVVALSIMNGFRATYDTYVIPFWIGIVTITMACVLTLFTPKEYVMPDPKMTRKEKKKLKTIKLSKGQKKLRDAVNNVYNELGVPDDAERIDILTCRYKVKNGDIIPVMSRLQYTPYINLSVRMFVQDRKLCIADLTNIYAFDLDSLKNIIKVNKRASFPYWNKTEKPKSNLYSGHVSYRSRVFTVKSYYILTLTLNDEEYGLYFPSYEIEKFERLAEVTASKKPIRNLKNLAK